MLEVSPRIARSCLRRTVGVLLVLWSCKPGAHTWSGSIPNPSAPASVHIRGRFILFLVLLIRMCIFLCPPVHISDCDTLLDPDTVLPPSLSQSSDVFCVVFCAADNCNCNMQKGGRPCDKSAATMNRDREKKEKANPSARNAPECVAQFNRDRSKLGPGGHVQHVR